VRSLCLVAMLASIITGCSSCPDRLGEDFRAPILEVSEPTLIVARVESFENIGGVFDLVDGSAVEFHSIQFVTESATGSRRVLVKFQGLPLYEGKHLELGQRVQFTLPAQQKNIIGGPYLKDIKDLVFLDAK